MSDTSTNNEGPNSADQNEALDGDASNPAAGDGFNTTNDPDSPGGVGELFVKAQEQGYLGDRVDPTPLHNYTSQGQAEGAKTPETDEDLAREAGQGGAALDARFGKHDLSNGPTPEADNA